MMRARDIEAFVTYKRLRSVFHCQYWKSIVYVIFILKISSTSSKFQNVAKK